MDEAPFTREYSLNTRNEHISAEINLAQIYCPNYVPALIFGYIVDWYRRGLASCPLHVPRLY